MPEKEELIKWLSEIKKEDSEMVGEKASMLGEIYRQKLPMTPGFVLTNDFYDYFMDSTGLKAKINLILEDLNIADRNALKEAAVRITESIEKVAFSKDMQEMVIEAYDLLDVNQETIKNAGSGALNILKNSREPVFVALRTSMPKNIKKLNNSKKEYFLNVKGHKNLLESIKKIYISFFREDEIYNRLSNRIENPEFKFSIIVQKMVDSDKSGIIYSVDNKQDTDNILIKAIWGLGVGRKVGIVGDKYVVTREDMSIIFNNVSMKEFAVTRNSSGENCTVKLTKERASQQTLTNHEIKILAQFALKIEEYMKKPQRIDFGISNGEIYILGSRQLNLDTKKKRKTEEVQQSTFGETGEESQESEGSEGNGDEKQESEDVPVKKDEDIEQVILKELDSNEYRPGAIKEKDEDMPRLNDAILVEQQSDLDEESKIDVV